MLQGGGALGAYQAGVYEALAEAGIQPNWIAGVSIGAVNAAIIAGNPPQARVDRLREFWGQVTLDGLWPSFCNGRFGFAKGGVWRNFINQMSAGLALASGARGFFKARAGGPWLQPDGGKLFYCAGAIAERYAGAGGKVIQAGKPFAPIFTRALELARGRDNKTIDRSRILVIGDAMRTDIKGAHEQGFDSLFVTSGIHRKELHGGAQDAGLDAGAFRQFMETSDFAPTAAIPELVW